MMAGRRDRVNTFGRIILAIVLLVFMPFLSVFATASVASANAKKIVLLPIKNTVVEEGVASSAFGFLKAEISKLSGVVVVEPGIASKRGDECDGNNRCLATLGKKLGADFVVTALLLKFDETHHFDLRLISVKNGNEEARVTEKISGDRELLIDALRGAAYQLLLPSKYVGSIKLDYSEPGAEVFLNGPRVGTTPLQGAITNLRPGKHALKITKQGVGEFNGWVEVKFDQLLVVKPVLKDNIIRLELLPIKDQDTALQELAASLRAKEESSAAMEKTRSKLRWVFGYGAVAVGVALVAAGVVQEARAASFKSKADAIRDGNGNLSDVNYEQARKNLDSYKTANTSGAILIGVGSAIAVGGGAYLYLTPASGGARIGVSGSF